MPITHEWIQRWYVDAGTAGLAVINLKKCGYDAWFVPTGYGPSGQPYPSQKVLASREINPPPPA